MRCIIEIKKEVFSEMITKSGKKVIKRTRSAGGDMPKGLLSNLRLMNDRTAVVLFLIFLVVIIFLFDSVSDQKYRNAFFKDTSERKIASDNVANELISELVIDEVHRENNVGFIVKGAVDPQKLQQFASMNYNQIKAHLGVDDDFMIHFEDENGRVIPIGNKWCIGSQNTSINGIPCG